MDKIIFFNIYTQLINMNIFFFFKKGVNGRCVKKSISMDMLFSLKTFCFLNCGDGGKKQKKKTFY